MNCQNKAKKFTWNNNEEDRNIQTSTKMISKIFIINNNKKNNKKK